jgi:putative endonuclease
MNHSLKARVSWRSHKTVPLTEKFCLASGSCPAPEFYDWYRAIAVKVMPVKFHYVYILLSLKDELFYIGYSDDLKQRVIDHNHGKNISTKNRRPLELIFYEAFPTKTDALKRERYFKTSKGKTVLRQMLQNYLNSLR